jgi:imidazolonepropionase-like amidohydrolase
MYSHKGMVQMKIRLKILILMLIAFQFCVAKATEPTKYAIKGGKILTMALAEDSDTSDWIIDHGIILVSNGKIEALGPVSNIKVPEEYTIIDALDRWVMPGIVESHTHIAVEDWGFNDMVTPINPELALVESVNSEDLAIKEAIAGGVTTIHTMPGSGTNLAGFSVIIKLDSSDPEKMIVRKLGAMKATQAFNPERRGGDLGLTRMGMSWSLRQILKRAKEYTEAWEAYEQDRCETKPEYKPELEKMRKVFQGEIPTIVHTYDTWGVMQTTRMFNDENHLKTIATHTAYGGHLIAKEVAKRENVFINIGPRLLDFYMPEGIMRHSARDNRFYGMGAEYYKAGVKNLSINTDAVGSGQEELALQAAMSARLGLDDEIALRAITINSAQALSIDDCVGSLEPGKDADIVIKKSSLLDVTTPVDLVLINGKLVYQRKGVNLIATEKQDSI